jgi:dihydropteroate synthase
MDMQRDPKYQNVSLEVLQYLQNKKRECEQAGIVDLIADPGFGFGKTIRHNFQLLSQLQILGMLDLPLLVGLSRKSMIYRTLNIDKEEALSGTQTLQTLALERGANILRVHDVKEALQTIKLWSEVHSYL